MPTIPVENHLADKICALYQKYGDSGVASTRYRDLADITRIIMGTAFNAERLNVILHREAARRHTLLPDSMVSPDESWEARFPIAARDFAEFPTQLWPLEAALAFAGSCLDEVLSGTRVKGTWHPAQQSWNDAGR